MSALGTRLCEVFGFDPNRVHHITIDITPGDPARVIVNMSLHEDDDLIEGVTAIITCYQLEEL